MLGPGQLWRDNLKFYNLKTRSHVEIPDEQITKKKLIRQTQTGEQVRYALTATHEGSKLYKFVSEAVYKSTNANEE